MKKYWIRILLGALGVFAVGMLVLHLGRHGVEEVRNLAMSHSFNIPPGNTAFIVGGRRLGTVTTVDLQPDATRGFPRVHLVVQLDSTAVLDSLENCTFLAGSSAPAEGGEGIVCAGVIPADSTVELGMVTFLPAGAERRLVVLQSVLSEMAWFNARDQSGGHPSGQRSGPGRVNVAMKDRGAFMLIGDAAGRPIFQLNADSTGAFILLRDSSGREIMRMRADSQGVTGMGPSD